MSRIKNLSAVLLTGALVLAACGGDTEASVEIAIAEAADSLPYAEAESAPCVAAAFISHVGFETLVADGHSTESFTLNPDSIVDVAGQYDSAELRDELEGCLDVDSMVRTELANQDDMGTLSCPTKFTTDTPLVREFIDGKLAMEHPKMDIEDTPELRDLFRPCLSDDDFAATFDLDAKDDLVEAIDSSFGETFHRDGSTCLGETLVDEVGFEELQNLGVTVANPKVDLDSLDLDSETVGEIHGVVGACSDFEARAAERYRTQEPTFGTCVVDSLVEAGDWLDAKVEVAFGSMNRTRSIERLEDRALDDCLEARVDEVYGPTTARDRGLAFTFAAGLYEGIDFDGVEKYGTTEAEYMCMSVGLFDALTSEGVYAEVEILNTANVDSAEFYEAHEAFWGTLAEERRRCSGDWLTIAGDVERAGFSPATLSCLREDFTDVEAFADTLTSRTWHMTEQEYIAFTDDLDAYAFSFLDALEDCYTDEDSRVYDAYIKWSEGLSELPDADTNEETSFV
ncbi:MAG: hypothetical protein R8J94_06965 [Acidimicrobiia bacterium]|nr:hypothetical protein [Acidimicrobiia bacterium]